MTSQEQIVISISDSEVFAILECTYVLAGIYVHYNGSERFMRRDE